MLLAQEVPISFLGLKFGGQTTYDTCVTTDGDSWTLCMEATQSSVFKFQVIRYTVQAGNHSNACTLLHDMEIVPRAIMPGPMKPVMYRIVARAATLGMTKLVELVER